MRVGSCPDHDILSVVRCRGERPSAHRVSPGTDPDPDYNPKSDPGSDLRSQPPRSISLSQETVADLNKQVPEEIPLNRFRPNIIVAGGEPWAEDRWQVCAGPNPNPRSHSDPDGT